jgi:hypothetical protein
LFYYQKNIQPLLGRSKRGFFDKKGGKMDLVKRFPEFRFVRHLSTEGRVIIIDEELSPGIQVAIEDLETTNGILS